MAVDEVAVETLVGFARTYTYADRQDLAATFRNIAAINRRNPGQVILYAAETWEEAARRIEALIGDTA